MAARSASLTSTQALDLEDLLDELRSRASLARGSQERLAGLLDAVVAVSSDLDLPEVLDRIVGAACALLDARYGALGVFSQSGEGLSAFVAQGVTDAEREAIGRLPRARGVIRAMMRERRPLRLEEISDHPESVGLPEGHPQMHSFLGVPILIRDTVFGNLYLSEKRDGSPFSEDDESVLVALAAAAGVAIDNARLFDHTRRQRLLSQALADLTRVLLETEDERDALRSFITDVAGCVQAPEVGIALWDEAGSLVVGAAHPAGCSRIPPAGSVLDGPQWQQAREADAPMALSDSVGPEDPSETETVADPVAILPVGVGSERVGILMFGWQAALPGVAFDTATAMVDFAQQTALALVAARAQRDRSRMALLEDRDRIARDMHDNVIQRLFATGLSLQSAARLAQHPLVRARLDTAVDELDESIRDIRRTIYELHRPIPSGGLRQQLRTLVDGAATSLGFVPTLTIHGSLAGLDRGLEADIVAVIREALSNVARHARATTAAVALEAQDTIRITVTDDGVGIEPGSARSGLVNLGSRATERSGRFSTRRRRPHGTVLRWQAPRQGRS